MKMRLSPHFDCPSMSAIQMTKPQEIRMQSPTPQWFTIAACLTSVGMLAAREPQLIPPTIVDAERIDKEPSAVSVISRDSLELFQASTFSDLSGIVPGFNVVSPDSRGYGQVVVMRGSTNTLFFGPPALGLIIDDVPLGDAYSYPSNLLELSEILVYRGPQGPNFGRNGPAGMVEMFTPRPGDKAAGSVTAEYGSYNHIGLALNSSGPLSGDLSYTLQLFHEQRDGYIRNTFLNDETDDRQATGGLLNLFWNPADDFELRVRFFTEHVDDGSQRLSSLFSPDPFNDSSDFRGRTDLERYQWSVHTRKNLDWGKIETITSYQTWDLDPSTVDLDLTFPNIFNGFADNRSTIIQSQDLVSNEIRFSSPDDAALQWKTGLFQMWIDNEGLASRQLVPPGFDEDTRFDIEQMNLAAFGNLTWQASDRLSVDAGLRVDYHESEIDRLKSSYFLKFPIGSVAVNDKQDEWFVSPVLGLTYEVNPAVDVFLRSGLGNKPAGFSAYSDNPALARYDRERNWSNEIGLQYDCPGYNLRVGLRGFWDQIDDYQFNQSVPGTTDFIILNAAEVTSRGVEIDAAWVPVERLTVRGSFGYVNAEFDSYQDPFNPGVSYDGNDVPFVPEYTGSLGIRYDFDSGFYMQTSARASGSTSFDAANNSAFTQDSYVLWDAEIGYARENFSVALFARNLLDEEYYTFINPQIFAGSPGAPQVFGLRVRTMF
jgi:iron complex outermembrane recepter protein